MATDAPVDARERVLRAIRQDGEPCEFEHVVRWAGMAEEHVAETVDAMVDSCWLKLTRQGYVILDRTAAGHEIRSRAQGVIDRHEEEHHDGEICQDERVGLVAYLAHSIGVHADMASRFFDAVIEYDEAHDHLHGEGRHHG